MYAYAPLATSSLYTGKESLCKRWDKDIKNQNHLGMEIKIMKMLIVTYHFHGRLKVNFGKINNQKFAFISPRILSVLRILA